MKRLILILLLLVSFIAHSQVVVNNKNLVFNLAPSAFYLEDKTGKKTIDDIASAPTNSLFQEIKKPVVNFGMTPSVYWVKATVRNETGENLFLELANPTLIDVQLFEFDSTGQLKQHQYSGNRVPFASWADQDLDYRLPLYAPPHTSETFFLRVQHYRGTQFTLNTATEEALYRTSTPRRSFEMVYYGMMAIMVLYNFFIYLTLRDKAYLYYVVYTFLMALLNAVVNGDTFKYLWPDVPALNQFIDVISCLVATASLLFAVHFLRTRQTAPFFHKILRILRVSYLALLVVIIVQRLVLKNNFPAMTLLFAVLAFITFALVPALIWGGIVVLRKGYQPAKYYVMAWTFLLVNVVIFILKDFNLLPYTFFTVKAMQIGSAGEALLLSLALADRINRLKKEKEEAQLQTMRSMEENEKLITGQNLLLEKKVEERTQELRQANQQLRNAIQNLEETQTQLTQREKMASLGELTAGIAHEIQNPLNFINNFSEVNADLVDELVQEMDAGQAEKAKAIAKDIKENEQKITHHGKRAEAIVKGMLQHARTSSGEKELTDINALADEYFRLSYHGFRAKNKGFNAVLETRFDSSLEKIEVVPQDLGRVFLNLFNNAFYAVAEKKTQLNGTFTPTVEIETQKEGDELQIRIRDNGFGISDKIRDKIFQPFFTTKPAGKGTGLGLSLSYDIITKGHGGDIRLETKQGEGSVFVIQLPLQT